MNEKVSFLIAAFNEEEYIEECVRSCLEQMGADIEVCIVDDGSRDRTLEILDGFSKDVRVRVRALERNLGKVAAFNAAYEMSTGDYIALLGGDDANTPGRVRLSLDCLVKNCVDMVYGDYYVCDVDLQPKSIKKVAEVFSVEDIVFNNRLSGGTFFFKRALADAAFPIPERLKFEDWWIGFVALSQFSVKRLDQPLIYYRHHGFNDSLGKVGESLKGRDFSRHDAYYDVFVEYLAGRGVCFDKLIRKVEEARFFKIAYLGSSIQDRLAIAWRFFAKFRLPRTSIGWAGLILIVPFGNSAFDFLLRSSQRRRDRKSAGRCAGRVTVLGVEFDNFTMPDLIKEVECTLDSGDRCVLALSNPEFLVTAHESLFLKSYLNDKVDINVADGVGVLLAAKLGGSPLRERVTGTDFVPALYKLAVARGYKIFFLGGRPGVANRAREILAERFGGDCVAGCRDGYFQEDDEQAVVQQVNESGAEVLMVCLGNPKQEQWIARNLSALGPRVVFGNGGALDFWAGEVKRAPEWVQGLGMEWLYRLGQDFTLARLKRQSRLIKFVYLVIRDWLSKRRFV